MSRSKSSAEIGNTVVVISPDCYKGMVGTLRSIAKEYGENSIVDIELGSIEVEEYKLYIEPLSYKFKIGQKIVFAKDNELNIVDGAKGMVTELRTEPGKGYDVRLECTHEVVQVLDEDIVEFIEEKKGNSSVEDEDMKIAKAMTVVLMATVFKDKAVKAVESNDMAYMSTCISMAKHIVIECMK